MEDTRSELFDLLEHARHTTPYYATRISPAASPDADPVRRLADVPLLSRGDVQRLGRWLWSSEGHGGDWRVVQTTGTTGEPIEVVVDRRAREAEADAFAAHADRCLDPASWRERDVVHLTLHAGASSASLPSPWHERARVVKWNLLRAWQRPDPSFVAALCALDGHVVTAMPSVIDLVCQRLARAGRRTSFAPLLVVLSGQVVERRVREQVREVLRCPVTSLYTLAEAGIVAAECSTTDGYHVEDDVAVVEVVDAAGHDVAAGHEGEIVVTPLQNRAMPLLRYRTGDRAIRGNRACGCGRSSDLLFLRDARRPQRIVTSSGATIDVVRYAKMFAGLNVRRVHVDQPSLTHVRVTYDADEPLAASEHALVRASLRGSLTPETAVTIERSTKFESAPVPLPSAGAVDTRAEPDGPSPDEIARWLNEELAERDELRAAVITGSFLDPEAISAFSDIDLVLLVGGPLDDMAWAALIRRLRTMLPRLRVNVSNVEGFTDRSPLLACRILREQHPVVGTVTEQLVPWPSPDSVSRAALLWSEDAAAALTTRLTDPLPSARDPIHEAWFASKYALDGLRYLSLMASRRETAARAVLDAAVELTAGPWLGDVVEAFDVAREQRMPPVVGSGNGDRYQAASLACARLVGTSARRKGRRAGVTR